MNRELLACPECDLLQHIPAPRPRKALCARCGAVLYRGGSGPERTLALTLTALVLLALANAFPILTLELQDERTTATLAGAARAPGFAAVFRLLQFASRWGTVEVFVLGSLVALVKLGHVASVEPGI